MVIISEAYTQLEDLETPPTKTETSKPNVSEGQFMYILHIYIYMYTCIYITCSVWGGWGKRSRGHLKLVKQCNSTRTITYRFVGFWVIPDDSFCYFCGRTFDDIWFSVMKLHWIQYEPLHCSHPNSSRPKTAWTCIHIFLGPPKQRMYQNLKGANLPSVRV